MKRKHYLFDGQLVKVYQKWSELRPRQKTGSWKKQENLFNGSQITKSALLPALKKVISFIRFMNQSSKKASGFLTEKYSAYYPRKYPDGMAVVSRHTDRHTLPSSIAFSASLIFPVNQ